MEMEDVKKTPCPLSSEKKKLLKKPTVLKKDENS